MAQLLRDGAVVTDNWQTVDPQAASLPESGNLLLSLAQWGQFAEQLDRHSGQVGLILGTDAELQDIPKLCLDLPLIVIVFTKFADGRGFSLARLLREQGRYRGELRAAGDILRDQLCLLKRCGFNAFQLEGVDISQAAKSLTDFSEAYQGHVEQPVPLFRRR